MYQGVHITYFTLREPLVNRKDFQALTLVGLPGDNPDIDPLAVLHLNNWLSLIKLRKIEFV